MTGVACNVTITTDILVAAVDCVAYAGASLFMFVLVCPS